MSLRIVECVLTFSADRDAPRTRIIADAIRSVAGLRLLEVTAGRDAGRTVITFAGDPQLVAEAAFQSVKTASQGLDTASVFGTHPRAGRADVCLFVPVEGGDLDDCAELARQLGRRVGEELGIPVHLCAHTARGDETGVLAAAPGGGCEGLDAGQGNANRIPDFGPVRPQPGAHVLITGAGEFHFACSITTNPRDRGHATGIALELQEKGRVARRGQANAFYGSGKEVLYAEGFFPCGNCSHDAATFEALEAHCREVHGYELRHLLRLNGVDATNAKDGGVVGQRACRAGKVPGLPKVGALMSMAAADLVDEVSRDTPTPGGGSVAALAGALGAALASMVANLTQRHSGGQQVEDAVLKAAESAERAKDVLVRCVDEDTSAFRAYLEARRLPRGTPGERAAREDAVQRSLRVAVDVPWRIAFNCVEAMKAASLAMRHGNRAAIADAMQGVVMGYAGAHGALRSVAVNLDDITDTAYRQAMQERCAGLWAEARRLMDEASAFGDQALERLAGKGK